MINITKKAIIAALAAVLCATSAQALTHVSAGTYTKDWSDRLCLTGLSGGKSATTLFMDGNITVAASKIDDAGVMFTRRTMSGINSPVYIRRFSFTNNKHSTSGSDKAGAIWNGWNYMYIQGSSFTGNAIQRNVSTAMGGAIYNLGGLTITSDAGTRRTLFESNSSTRAGGAIANAHTTDSNLGSLVGRLSIADTDFIGNIAGTHGGAIYNDEIAVISGISNSVFNGNKAGSASRAGSGGAIYTKQNLNANTSSFLNNSAYGDGGAIWAKGPISLTDTNFTGNSATGKGGAIYANQDVTLTAVTRDVTLSGNQASGAANDIYISGSNATTKSLNLRAFSGKTLTVNSGIDGVNTTTSKYNVLVNGGGYSGTVMLNAAMTGANALTLNSGMLKIGSAGRFATSAARMDLTLNAGTLDTRNGVIDTLYVNRFTSALGSNFALDASLAGTPVSDQLNVNTTVSGSRLNINGISILSHLSSIGQSAITRFITQPGLTNTQIYGTNASASTPYTLFSGTKTYAVNVVDSQQDLRFMLTSMDGCANGYWDDSGICRNCPAGASGTGNGQGCVCPSGSTWNRAANTCVPDQPTCPSNQYLSGSTCIPCVGDSFANANQTGCICYNTSKIWDYSTNTCVPIQPTCTGNQYISGTTCAECVSGSVVNASRTGCVCPSGSTWNQSTNTCVPNQPTCTSNQYLSGGACITCVSGSSANAAKTGCVCADSGKIWDFSTNTCVTVQQTCTGNQYISGTTCAECVSGSVVNAARTGCGCSDSNKLWDIWTNQCLQIACPSNQYLQNGVCQSCPAGQQANATQTGCDACPANQYSVAGGFCQICPAGQEVNAAQSGCQACPANRYSVAGGVCQMCPAGQQVNANKTGCSVCPANQYSVAGGICQSCPAGQVPNETQSGCTGGLQGLPRAVADANIYKIYDMVDDGNVVFANGEEVVNAWSPATGNTLQGTLLAIQGNGYGITTQTHLMGVVVGDGQTLHVQHVGSQDDGTSWNSFNTAIVNSGTLNISDSVFKENDSTVVSGPQAAVSGRGGAIYNAGVMQLWGDNLFADNTAGGVANDIYNVGTLSVIGGTTTIRSGISGTGTISIAGRLDIGTTKIVSGSTALTGDAVLALQIAGKHPTQYGQLFATSISVSDGTRFDIDLASGLVKRAETAAFDVLNANNVSINLAVFGEQNAWKIGRRHKGYFGTDDKLYIVGLTYPCGDRNTCNIADAWLDEGVSFADGSFQDQIMEELERLGFDLQDGPAFDRALRALAPNIAPIVTTQAADINRQLFNLVESRLTHTGGFRALRGRAYMNREPRNDTALWANAVYGISDYDTKSNPYDVNNYTMAVGLDNTIARHVRIGAGYAYTQSDISAVGKEIEADTHTLMAYLEYNPRAFFWNALATYGWSKYDEDRYVSGNAVEASYDVAVFGLQSTVGYNLGFAHLGGIYDNGRRVGGLYTGDFIPHAGIRYFNVRQDGYTDTALQTVGKKNMNILTGLIGVKYDLEYPVARYSSVRAEATIAGTYDFIQPDTDTSVAVANGPTYRLYGENQNRLGLEAGARMMVNLARELELALRYTGVFKADYSNHTGTMELRYIF